MEVEVIKLLGIVIVVVGFALKWDSILTIMLAAVVTAIIAGMDPVVFLQTLGKGFVSNRNMLISVVIFLLTGTLERNGLKSAARALMGRIKRASAGLILGAYGVFRVIFAAFNVGFGGVAGFVKPVVMPMAEAADETGATGCQRAIGRHSRAWPQAWRTLPGSLARCSSWVPLACSWSKARWPTLAMRSSCQGLPPSKSPWRSSPSP